MYLSLPQTVPRENRRPAEMQTVRPVRETAEPRSHHLPTHEERPANPAPCDPHTLPTVPEPVPTRCHGRRRTTGRPGTVEISTGRIVPHITCTRTQSHADAQNATQGEISP